MDSWTRRLLNFPVAYPSAHYKPQLAFLPSIDEQRKCEDWLADDVLLDHQLGKRWDAALQEDLVQCRVQCVRHANVQ